MDPIILGCPPTLKIHVTNAYLYDDLTHNLYNNCSDASTFGNKALIGNAIGDRCNDLPTCSFMTAVLGTQYDWPLSGNLTCLSAKFEWICFTYSSKFYLPNCS